MTEIPIVKNDKGEVLGYDGQQWRAPDAVAKNDAGRRAFRFGDKWQIEPMPEPTSALGTAGVTAGSIGASFNEGVAQAADMIPQMGRWIRRQFDSSIPPLQSKDPAGVRTALKSVGIPVGDLETQKREYGVQEGPIRRIGGTAAKIAGQSVPFLPVGPAGQALKATVGAAVGGAAGSEIGGETGELIGAVAGGLRGGRAPVPYVPPARTIDEVKQSAKAMFDASEKSGVILSQQGFQNAVNNLRTTLTNMGIDHMNHPQAFRAFQRLEADAARGHLTPKHWHTLRQVIDRGPGKVSLQSASGPSEREFARVMRGALDDYIDSVATMPGGVIQGNLAGMAEIRQGISEWRRYRGLKTIERLVDRAKTNSPSYTAAGYDTALRNEFKSLVKNESQMKFFTKAEQAALKKVARGGHVANTFRQLGRLSPQNIMYALLGANLHPAMLGASAAGLGARLTATGLTKRNLKFAEDLIARGYSIPNSLKDRLARYRGGVPVAASAILGQK